MKKKITRRNFIALTVVAFILLVFTVVGFNIPFTTNTFKGFAKSIKVGFDFGDGTRATYQVTNSDYSKYSEETFISDGVKIIQDKATEKYTDARVYQVGDDQIVVEVPDTYIPSDLAIGQLEIKTEATAEAETHLNGSHVKSAKFQMNGADYGVLIQFTKEGSELIKEMTSSASEDAPVNIVFCLNSDYENAMKVSTANSVEEGYVYFTMADKASAKLFASRIANSKYGINLVQIGETAEVYSNVSIAGKVISATVVALLVAGSFAYLVTKFRAMGLISSLALMFFALFNVITFALIPSFRLTMGSYIGMLLGYIVTFFAVVTLIEKYKSEFESGKKLNASFKSGYMKALPIIADTFAICGIFSIICLILGSGYIFSFAYSFLINCAWGAVFTLAVMLWFSRMYLKINSVDGKKLNFNKEAQGNAKETK